MNHNNDHLWQLLTEMRQEIKELRQEVNRYKGFIGGVLFIVNALWAAGLFVYSYFKGV